VSRKLHPESRGRIVLLNKLESGFVLLQTQQGSVAVQPSSFWQRVYLLWTFRNFRQLSLPLLNARQTALLNDLFRQHAAVISHDYEPWLEIGVVENFVPAAIETGAALAAKTAASPAVKAKLPELTAGQSAAPPVIRVAAAPVMMADVAPAVNEGTTPLEGTGIDGAEIAPKHVPVGSFAPIISWLRLAWSNLATSKPAAFRLHVSRIVILGFAAAIGALSLGMGFMVAFHRTGAAPGSEAHASPPQVNAPDAPSAPEPTSAAENPDTAPEVTPQAGAGPDPNSPSAPGRTSVAEDPATVPEATPQADAVADATAKPTPAETASPITTTHRMTTPKRASRGAAARAASKSSGGFHAAAFSRVPTSTSTRRTALAPGPHGATARSAQRYFDLADQQMHKGNYAAAAANYKRAWRIEQNRAAAKGRLARARRTMQAEKESIAPPQ